MRVKAMPQIPTFDQYLNPTLRVLRRLGGSATNRELYEKVAEDMKLSDDQLAVIHNEERGSQTEVEYRMAWARTYLKKAGFLDNSKRGVWVLTRQGTDTPEVDAAGLVQKVRSGYQTPTAAPSSQSESPELPEERTAESWRAHLMNTLLSMPPDAFERLSQLVLRESGFVEVKVEGRTGDGGIDGTGILRLQNLVSIPVAFQCKRWKPTVQAREIRDFRGAMQVRAEKGLFITTSTYSRGAEQEATKPGAPLIDLVTGDQFIDLLKQLELGVKTELVEEVTVNEEWFKGI